MGSLFRPATKVFLYQLGPIDSFAPFLPVDQYLARLSEQHADDAQLRAAEARVERLMGLIIEHTHFDPDDVVAGPYVSALPIKDGYFAAIMVTVKIRNNGSVYVASPVELTWLNDGADDFGDNPIVVEFDAGT